MSFLKEHLTFSKQVQIKSYIVFLFFLLKLCWTFWQWKHRLQGSDTDKLADTKHSSQVTDAGHCSIDE